MQHGHPKGPLPIAPYPPPYNAQKQLMTDWTFDYPIQRPEMLLWGTSIVVAAFMIAAPRVVAGFAGFGVSDEKFLKAEEAFANHVYQFDNAVECQTKRRRLTLMKKAWVASGHDSDIAKQLNMRSNQYLRECR